MSGLTPALTGHWTLENRPGAGATCGFLSLAISICLGLQYVSGKNSLVKMKVVVPHRNDKLHEAGLMSLPCSKNLHQRNLKSVDHLSGAHDKRIVVEIHLYPHPFN